MYGMSGTLSAGRTDVSALAAPGLAPAEVYATLRQEFEKALVSPYGVHLTPESCAKAWAECPWPDAELRRQVGIATVWLSRCERTRRINIDIGTSYHLKHLAADWLHATRHGDGYSLNGCFVMAAV